MRIIPLFASPTPNTPEEQAAFLQANPVGGGTVSYEYWPVPPELVGRSQPENISDADKQAILDAFGGQRQRLAAEQGYTTSDVIAVHQGIPGIAAMLGKFDREHFHTDDEVRYIVAGQGYFGFRNNDGRRFVVEVEAGDFLSVPVNSWHWFYLGAEGRITAIRFFKDASGWTPHYEGTPGAVAGV